MNAFNYEALWNKSRVFIARGLRERDAKDFGGFQLWAALALELLGKAALAKSHPVLVADPQHTDSIFAACGHPSGTDNRSITAKTVFERLGRLSKSFDKEVHGFCTTISTHRNAELHSGELPFVNAKTEAWVPKFWKTMSIILKIQDRTLTEWVGPEEAQSAQDVIDESISVVEQAVIGRIRSRKVDFEGRYPPASGIYSQVKVQHKGGALVHWRDFGNYLPEQTIAKPCPACGCDGLLGGDEFREETIDHDMYNETWSEVVRISCSAEAFRCRACGLSLDGQEELHAAQMADEFAVTEAREAEYGDPYGND